MFLDYAREDAATAMLARATLMNSKIQCDLELSWQVEPGTDRLMVADDDAAKTIRVLQVAGCMPRENA